MTSPDSYKTRAEIIADFLREVSRGALTAEPTVRDMCKEAAELLTLRGPNDEAWFDFDKTKPSDKARVRIRLFSGTETDARYYDGDFECECVKMPRWITGQHVFRWQPSPPATGGQRE